MAYYAVETYLSVARRHELEDAAARARAASRELTDAGVPVEHLRSVFLSEDETCFHFFQAPSLDTVREVLARAGLKFERIGPAETATEGRKEEG